MTKAETVIQLAKLAFAAFFAWVSLEIMADVHALASALVWN